MSASGPTNSSPPLNTPTKDGLSDQLDSMTNPELFSFMSCRRSEFSRIAAILKEREESAKAEASKDLSATVAELKDTNDILEKELLALRNNEAKIQKDCTSIRESEKLAQEKINDLMEEVRRARDESASRRVEDELNALKQKYLEIVQKETDLTRDLISYRTYCSSLKVSFTSLKSAYSTLEVSEKNTDKRSKLLEEVQLKLDEARNERIAEFDIWKQNFSPIETWIQEFVDNNPHLVEKAKEPTTRNELRRYVPARYRVRCLDSAQRMSGLAQENHS